MRDRETATRQIGEQRLDVAQAASAGGRIAHMPRCHLTRQFGQGSRAREILRDMAQTAARVELGTVETGDPDRFLAAMLERVEAQRGNRRRLAHADHAEDAALFAQFVAVCIAVRMCEVHCVPRTRCDAWAPASSATLWRGMAGKARAALALTPPAAYIAPHHALTRLGPERRS